MSGPGGAAINTISAVSEIKVRFPVAEKDYLRLVEYQKKDTSYLRRVSSMPVDLVLDDGTLYPLKGKLDLMNRQVDASTGSLLVQAIFDNRQGILRPGQYVKVRFRTGLLTDAVLVPQKAVNLEDVNTAVVPAKAIQAVDAKREELQSGKWDVFMGPIKDQSGAVKIAAGQNLTDPELQRINWYVEGVDGSLPK